MDKDTRKTQFNYASDMPDFWRLIEGINWSEKNSPEVVREDLMKQLSPSLAQRYSKILYELAQHLCSKYVQYVEDQGERCNTADTYFAACNVVGGGKLNYEEFDKNIKYLASELESLDMDRCFARAIPTEDHYYYAA